MLRQDASFALPATKRIRIGSVHGGYILWGGGLERNNGPYVVRDPQFH